MEMLFWLALAGAGYSYFVYPLILLSLPARRARKTRASGELPRLSLVVTAHNEAERIRHKLENSLALRYPRERLEIVVASDASDDGTDQIVAEYAAQGVRLVRTAERLGKENAQRLAIESTQGDIIVFSDVATRISPDSLHRIARLFADPEVGAVSSEDRFISPDGVVIGEGMYVRYEMWLRRLESDVNSLVGLSGSFFAVRRSVCQDWDVNSPSDFNAALQCARTGYAAVSDPELLGYYPAIREENREYQRKLRTVLRGMASVVRHPDVLNPIQYGMFSFQVWSHKIMRWLVPWFLLLLLVVSSTLAVSRGGFYTVALALQLAFYGLVLSGWLSHGLRARSLVKIPFFFVQVNIAIAHAAVAFMLGKRVTTWQPSKR